MKYGLIGEKLGHSFSAPIHNRLGGYDYELCSIPRDQLDEFMTRRDFEAINVTIPYKQDVIPYCDGIEENAARIGAVNTLVNRGGKLWGYNTDFMGLRYLLEKHSISICEKNVLILGSGGTSKTAEAVCRSMGAKTVFRVSRTEKNGMLTYEQAAEKTQTQVVINTTPCGMYPNCGTIALDPSVFPRLEAVADAVYNPIRTMFVQRGKELGVKAAGGLEMLVAQALYASELFIDRKLDPSLIDSVYRELLLEKSNIVLIGMPSCGKSSVGKLAAQRCGKKFVDMDEEIVAEAGCSIPEIFEKEGETGFRKRETACASRLSKENGLLISTGGGIVKKAENMRALKQNGVVIYLDRPAEMLDPGTGRPLFRSPAELNKLLAERIPLYEHFGEIKVTNTGTLQEAAEKIKEKTDEILYHKWP